jgi:hypothetical protein
MISISCWCYFEILKRRGKLGQNSVGVAETSHGVAGGLFLIENAHREISARENIEMQAFANMQRQAEVLKQQAEIDSAVLSLKTNLTFFLVLISIYSLAFYLSSDILAVLFSLFKNLAPVLTSIINFVKIRKLFVNVYEDGKTWFMFFRDRIVCQF